MLPHLILAHLSSAYPITARGAQTQGWVLLGVVSLTATENEESTDLLGERMCIKPGQISTNGLGKEYRIEQKFVETSEARH